MTSEPSERVPVEAGEVPEEFRARHDALLAALDRGVCYLDHDGCIASVNVPFAEMAGRSMADVRGERLSTLFTPDEAENGGVSDVDDAVARLADADADEMTLDGTFGTDGRPATLRLRRVGADEAGDTAVVAVVRERAARDPAARLARDSDDRAGVGDVERQFESLVDAVEEYAIFVLDADGYVASWNEGARQIKGYDREEILGRHYSTFFTEADAEAGVPQQYLSEARERGSVDMQGWRVRKDGSQFWANATLTAIRDADGELVGYTKVTRDMSARRERRQRIREDRDLLNRVLETSPVAVVVIAEDGRVVHTNTADRPVFDEFADGGRVGDLDVYDADGEFVPPAERPYVTVFETGEPVENWLGQVDAEDGRRWVCVNAAPLTDASGDVERVVVTMEDVTEFKEQEAQLERQRDELAEEVTEMFERVSDAFFGLNTDWEFTYVNERAEEFLGVSAEDLAGEYVWDLFDEDSADQFREQYEYAMEHQEAVNFEAYYEEPLDAWFHVSAYPSETGLSVYFRDVTERKEYERELTESEERYRTLVENLPDGAVSVFDTDLRYTLAGGEALETLDLTPDALVGSTVREALPDVADTLGPAYEAALSGDHAVVDIEYGDRTFESHVRPIRDDDGEVVAGLDLVLDVTERHEYERTLAALNEATHAFPQAETRADVAEQLVDVTTDVLGLSGVTVYLHDPEAGVLYDAAHSADMQEVYGALPTVSDDPTSSVTADAFAAGETRVYEDITESDLLSNPETGARRSLLVPLDGHGVLIISDTRTGGFEERTVELAELVGANGTSALDMVEREETLRENERQLRRYEQIVETVWDGVYALDGESTFALVNEAFLELTGYDRDELLGEPASMLYDDHVKEKAERMIEEIERGEREVGVLESDIVTKDGDTIPVEVRFGPYRYGEDTTGRTGVMRDITHRRRREEELQTRIRQQEVITELGQYVIRTGEFDDVLQRATELVSETLDTDYSKVLDLDAERNELLLRAGVGWKPGVVGEATVRADTNSQAGYTLLTDGPVVVDDLAAESRFTGPDLLLDHDVTSGISTVIGSKDDPWGVLGTHDTEDKEFTDNDVAFVQNVATILTNAVERERQERQLEHQREQLAALNQLNRVVQGITRAVVEKSSREEIENLVCDRLADTYQFAWIGEVGRGNREVMVRTEAGVEDYLSDITLDLDDETTSKGPTATAIRTREMQVARNIPENPDYVWQDHAKAHGFRSSAAIPITHEGSLYGVLNIYSERPDAFDGQEGAVLSQLGDIVGHAINSVERKQALMSDEMVELELYLPNVADIVGMPEEYLGGEIRFERTVPTGDGEYLVYGSMTEDARDMMDALRESLPHFGDLRVLSEAPDEVTFELKLVDPPAISVMAGHGGRIASARLAGGDYEMRVHLPQTADVREVVTSLQDKYPDVELVAQRRTTKSDAERESGPVTLTADLTDRQRAVLEAAFRSGFFEWPRESTGEDIADSVGITASTLHQHLRAAERKLVDTYLDG